MPGGTGRRSKGSQCRFQGVSGIAGDIEGNESAVADFLPGQGADEAPVADHGDMVGIGCGGHAGAGHTLKSDWP